MNKRVKESFKPLFFIEPKSMTAADIKRAEGCGIYIVECVNPTAIRQCQPEPLSMLEDKAKAALAFISWAVVYPDAAVKWGRADIAYNFMQFLLQSDKPKDVQQIKQVKKV